MKNASRLFAVAMLVGMAISAPAGAAGSVIQVANWNNYVDDKVVDAFTAQTGVKVEYKTFETDEEGVAMIREPGMDVVAPPTAQLKSIIAAGLLKPFADGSIEGWKEAHPLIMQRVRLRDPHARHVVPYLWGRIGLLVDAEKVRQALGHEVTASWDLVFSKESLAKLASCGVSILDSPNDVLNIYSLYRGRMIDRISEREVTNFKQEMKALAPLYSGIDSAAYLEQMPRGELCVAMVWEGDGRTLQAAHDNLMLLMPGEGTALFMDSMAIASASDNPEGAKLYIEFMSRPENSMLNAQHTGYNSPSRSVMEAMARSAPGRAIDMAQAPAFLPQPPSDSLYRDLMAFWPELLQAVGSQVAKRLTSIDAQARMGALPASGS